MFDVGFWELVLLGVVALVVLGPERLPQVARTAGRMVARARSYASTFTDELDRQTRDVEGQSGIGSIREEFNRAKSEFTNASKDITSAGQKLKTDTDKALADVESDANAAVSKANPEAVAAAKQQVEVEGFGNVDEYVDEYMHGITDAADEPDVNEADADETQTVSAAPSKTQPEPDGEVQEVQGKTS